MYEAVSCCGERLFNGLRVNIPFDGHCRRFGTVQSVCKERVQVTLDTNQAVWVQDRQCFVVHDRAGQDSQGYARSWRGGYWQT